MTTKFSIGETKPVETNPTPDANTLEYSGFLALTSGKREIYNYNSQLQELKQQIQKKNKQIESLESRLSAKQVLLRELWLLRKEKHDAMWRNVLGSFLAVVAGWMISDCPLLKGELAVSNTNIFGFSLLAFSILACTVKPAVLDVLWRLSSKSKREIKCPSCAIKFPID